MADHRCPYCVSRPSTEFNIEHVIPAKLGGTLTIDAHAGCNDWSATHVDNPLMADWDVETLRAMSGVRNTRRGGQPKGAQFPANLDDQARVLLDFDTSGVRIRQVAAGTPIPSGEGEYTFTLGPGPTLAEQAERMLARIRAEHPGKTVNLIAQELRRSKVALDAQRRLRKDVWPRFAAKVALGALSQTMPEEWRGSDGWVSLMALYLAGLVIGSRGGRGLPALPSVLTNDPHNGMWRNLYPWEHVIVLQTVPGVVTVSVVLFGELRYDLPVATPLQPAGPRVWLCEYREKTPLTFASVHELALAVTERAALFGEVGLWRPDRPRRRLLSPIADAILEESQIVPVVPAA